MNIQVATAQKIVQNVVAVAINEKNREKVVANDLLVRRDHVLALVELVLRKFPVEIDQGNRLDLLLVTTSRPLPVVLT